MKALFIVLVCLLYILLPLDVLPDFIPLIGRFDDLLATVLTAVFLYRRRHRARSQNQPGPQAPLQDRPPEEPHEVLGVRRDAAPEEIRKAYRELIAQYHPDKVAHLGPDLRETANRKTLEIQRAYEALCPEGRR